MTYLKRAEKKNGKFLNPVPTAMFGAALLWKVLPRFLFNKEEVVPRSAVGQFVTDASVYSQRPASGLRVTWFGHSAMLMEIDGVRVLVDPVWEQRASPVRWFGPQRFFAPTLALEEMPSIDAVLISHDHYDHMGADTIRSLARMPATAHAQWVTSLGIGRRLAKLGVPAARIVELNWTETATVTSTYTGDLVRITSWPARHFSGRGLFDRFKTLWASFVVEGAQHRVYFGADSGCWDVFAEIAAQYDGFDLTMLEIGAYDELWESIHLGPDHAVDAFLSMGKAGLLMPIHWGLFNLGLHGWRQPMERTELISGQRGVGLWSPEPGVPTEIAGEYVSDWWRL